MNNEPIDVGDGAGEAAEQTKPTFQVVIAYDGRSAGTRAMDLFSVLAREFGGEFEFHCDLWRFDVLEFPEARDPAVRAGANADLLVIAARCMDDLPLAVKNWLGRSIAAKSPGSAALVGLLESCAPSSVRCPMRNFLQSTAHGGGLDLFLHEIDSPRGSMLEDIEGRATTVSSAAVLLVTWRSLPSWSAPIRRTPMPYPHAGAPKRELTPQ